MTQSLEALKRQKSSLEGIRSVVHTMKTLSVINAAPYEHAARAIDAYRDTVLDGLHAFFKFTGPLAANEGRMGARVMIVFGSDHGLCGSYNQTLAAQVVYYVKHTGEGAPMILCVGAQMADALASCGLRVEEVLFPPASVDGIGRLADLLTQKLDILKQHNQLADIEVSLAFFARGQGNMQAPEIMRLLPLDSALIKTIETRPWTSRSLPTFSMPPDELFTALIQKYLFTTLFQAAAEALVTENAARLALMQQAEQSVDERLDVLNSETLVLRQAEITTELLDVIIGFEALKKREQTRHN